MSSLDSGSIGSSETLTRYLFQRSHFSRTKGRVKYSAFLPISDGQTSVFRVSSLADSEIWSIGVTFVASVSRRTIRARADTVANEVTIIGLDVVPDPAARPRHANIVNWPEEASKRKLFAMLLANSASLALPDVIAE